MSNNRNSRKCGQLFGRYLINSGAGSQNRNYRNLVSVNQFINAVYPDFLERKNHSDIVEHFVKYLYEK